ncbi:uncharacterized protein LOC143628503 [Bidens hawaiensis]|uniref:uncharacterized protein LOC143628503 n=1 Tax=Bidens hawaiensis TaxID=980011 RepID=UPI00404AA399
MAETEDLHHHHLVEIPASSDHESKLNSALKDHLLMEISDSPGHLLLLKLLQREEDLIALKETRLDTLRREVFQLCLFFFAFHILFFTILFGSSNNNNNGADAVCHKWWIPMMTSSSFCAVIVVLGHMNIFSYWKVYGQILLVKTENQGLTRFCRRYFVTLCLVLTSGSVLPVCKFMVCY